MQAEYRVIFVRGITYNVMNFVRYWAMCGNGKHRKEPYYNIKIKIRDLKVTKYTELIS